MAEAQMVVCGNCAVFSDGVKVAVCSVPSLEVIAPEKTGKVTLPMASDGQYVYALSVGRRLIKVFAVTSKGELIEQSGRRVKLQAGTNMETGFSDLIPKGELQVLCNGSVFTIIVLARGSSEFKHLWRSFSAFDGSHICDLVASQAWPICGLACDPWQSVVWQVTQSDKTIKLVRLPNYGARAWFHCDIPTNSVTTAAVLQQKLNGIKTGKGLWDALLEFFAYYAIHFFWSFFPSIGYLSKL
jgi:hypothetical protein